MAASELYGELEPRGDAKLSEQRRQLISDRLFLDTKLLRDRLVTRAGENLRDERSFPHGQVETGFRRKLHRPVRTSPGLSSHEAGG